MIAVAKAKAEGDTPEPERDSRPGRKSAPIQIEKDLARMAAVIAAHDGVTLSELLSPQLRQFIRTNYERVQKEIQERVRLMKEADKKG